MGPAYTVLKSITRMPCSGPRAEVVLVIAVTLRRTRIGVTLVGYVAADGSRRVTRPPDGGAVPRKIVLDCDPGHDDAIALLVAHGSPEIELLAVTSVAGNQTIEKVTHNALVTARVAGIAGVP